MSTGFVAKSDGIDVLSPSYESLIDYFLPLLTLYHSVRLAGHVHIRPQILRISVRKELSVFKMHRRGVYHFIFKRKMGLFLIRLISVPIVHVATFPTPRGPLFVTLAPSPTFKTQPRKRSAFFASQVIRFQ